MVYVFESQMTGLVKIGLARDPYRRMVQVKHAAGNPVSIVLLFRTGKDRDLERELHRKFAKYRVCGEWFRNRAVVRRWIDKRKDDLLGSEEVAIITTCSRDRIIQEIKAGRLSGFRDPQSQFAWRIRRGDVASFVMNHKLQRSVPNADFVEYYSEPK